jgi:uncharacterized protein YbbC (DUF1343 family)
MTKTGLDLLLENFPSDLIGKRIGLICHAASVTARYTPIIEAFTSLNACTIGAIFGPQHGLFGQTQDNMIEWEGKGGRGAIPIYSLYGAVRKPTPGMLDGVDALLYDLQDVGARPYTYLWTLKLCMEACAEKSIPLFVLDRPNPVGRLDFDGPMLDPAYFSFVGGADIPLCHRMTVGEIATLLQHDFYPNADLRVVWMEGWWRDSLFGETGLPWVLPSPNMPTPDTAIVYPGMVLIEATNLSEGRGTTRPFEIFGAPWLPIEKFKSYIAQCKLPGCLFREHGFIPTFQKWAGKECAGMQIHITDPGKFRPVETAAAVILAAQASAPGEFRFRTDPYEYEREKPAIDILTGSDNFRKAVLCGASLDEIKTGWMKERERFLEKFARFAHYPERRS